MISVIIPFYNHHQEIELCLKPLLDIDLIGEVIVVDDFSDEAFHYPHSKVRVIRLSENMGPSYCRQRGQSEAHFKTYCFIDADVVIKEKDFKKANQLIQSKQCDVIIGKVANVSFPSPSSYFKNYYIHYQLSLHQGKFVDFIYGSFCMTKLTLNWPIEMRIAEDNYLGKMISPQTKIYLCPDLEFVHLKKLNVMELLKYDLFMSFHMARTFLFKLNSKVNYSHSNRYHLASLLTLAFFWLALFTGNLFSSSFVFLLWPVLNYPFWSRISKETTLRPQHYIPLTFLSQTMQGLGAFIGIMYYAIKFK